MAINRERLLQHFDTLMETPEAIEKLRAFVLGRAVLADPGGYFHIVSKDKGYDALIEHLRSKHIRARRHDDFTTLTFSAPAKSPAAAAPAPARAATSPVKSKAQSSPLEALESRVLEHLRKPTTQRPGTKKKLISYLIAHLGKKVSEADILKLIEMMSRAGHLVSDDKGVVTFYLSPK